MTIFLVAALPRSMARRRSFLAGLLAGALAQFCAAFYDASFDFDLGEKLLGNRRQSSGPGRSDNTDEDPGNAVVKSLFTRETFVAEHAKRHDLTAADRNKGG
jgi:hypothetical protein